MDILFLLIPLSVLLALAVMGVLAWAVWAGQFEELDSEGERILMTDDDTDANAETVTSLIHVNTPTAGLAHTQVSHPQKRQYP